MKAAAEKALKGVDAMPEIDTTMISDKASATRWRSASGLASSLRHSMLLLPAWLLRLAASS